MKSIRTMGRSSIPRAFALWHRGSSLLCFALVVILFVGTTTPAYARPVFIKCRIEKEGWEIFGKRVVKTWMGDFECSPFVRHAITSKIVKKRWIGWKDYSVLGTTTQFADYWRMESFEHMVLEDGTFHVYLEDYAETIDGRRERLLSNDGPPFTCAGGTCQ